MTYSIEQLEGITHVRFPGMPTVDDINAASEKLSHMENAAKRLWVFEAGVSFTADEVRSIANQAQSRTVPRSWVAIVADQNIAYGLSRMYAVFRTIESVTVKVFTNENQALAWLRVQGSDDGG